MKGWTFKEERANRIYRIDESDCVDTVNNLDTFRLLETLKEGDLILDTGVRVKTFGERLFITPSGVRWIDTDEVKDAGTLIKAPSEKKKSKKKG